MRLAACLAVVLTAIAARVWAQDNDFVVLRHNNPGLVVDLGVGLWAIPLPMDYDGDGDNDLVVATNNKPSNGIYFFENISGKTLLPVFQPGVYLGKSHGDVSICYPGGEPLVLTPGQRHPEFRSKLLTAGVKVGYSPTFYIGRGNRWTIVDFDGDGKDDLVIGAGDWREYGWDDAYDAAGRWTRGPLHGHVWWMKNEGTREAPRWAAAQQLQAGGRPLDTFGNPAPQFADFDGDGDLDLVCGEFLDRLTYFENVGSRRGPRYAEGKFLVSNGQPIRLDLEMIEPVAFDWDGDGDTDLVVGQEDGRVALVENTGRQADGGPEFKPPVFFRQQADLVKVGALATPCGVDWDGDGDEDIISGDSAGYLSFVENLGGGHPPRWAAPVCLHAEGRIIRIQAGDNGSIQGPAEAKWGYTVPCVADFDADGDLDIVLNSIWGKIQWLENVGSRRQPRLRSARALNVRWPGTPPKPQWNWWSPEGRELVTQWRTVPAVCDLRGEGLPGLAMLDHEGFLAYFARAAAKASRAAAEAAPPDAGAADDRLELLPGQRIFHDALGQPLQLSGGRAGKSGRRKFTLADWDQDGRLDILINGRNIDWLRNVGSQGQFRFENRGPLAERMLAGHDTCPTTVDWDRNGVPDLLVGAEDGFFYYLANPHARRQPRETMP